MNISMVRGFVVFLLCCLGVACTTIGEKNKPNESGYSNEPLPLIYEGTGLCGYYEDELLYLYYPRQLDLVLVYNKELGVYAKTYIKEMKKSFKCSGFSLSLSSGLANYNRGYDYSLQQEFVFLNEMRSILDNFIKNPSDFEKKVSKPSKLRYINFISENKVEDSTLSLQNVAGDFMYLGDIRDYYKDLSSEESDKLINAALAKKAKAEARALRNKLQEEKLKREREAEKERKEREEKLRIEHFKMEQIIAQERWDNRLGAQYNIGDKVCTYDNNDFGYIEYLNANKMKVHVVGQADRKNGFFFSGIDGNFNYKKVEAIRWFDRNELAHCNFN